MDERTKKVARHITERKHISKNPSKALDDSATFGQRATDAVAKFGASWAFIMLFAAVLVCWVILNSYILINYNKAFDPYPYILLIYFYLCWRRFKPLLIWCRKVDKVKKIA